MSVLTHRVLNRRRTPPRRRWTSSTRSVGRTAPVEPSTLIHPWRYRWDVTLTIRDLANPTVISERRVTAETADELANIVLHTSLDPRIVAYQYYRCVTLDLTDAPTSCAACTEQFADLPPRQVLRTCSCSGHMIYTCIACGVEQLYPPRHTTCR